MFAHWKSLSASQKKIVIGFATFIIGVYIALMYSSVRAIANNQVASELAHTTRITPAGIQQKKIPVPLATQKKITKVRVGTYIDTIDDFSIKESEWNTTFYIWFTWQGEPNINPGAKFQIIDGIITEKELLKEYYDDHGTNYQQYLVSAKITKFFNTYSIPLDDHMLNLYIEDGAKEATQLQYVADEFSGISSNISIPGYKIASNDNIVKNHTYASTFGDPSIEADNKTTYSQYVCSMQIKRSSFGFYIKIFLSLFAALLLTFVSFFIRASEIGARFALTTGAYFGAVANTYVVNSLLPSSGAFGLMDIITGIGLITIFLSIVLTLYSNYLFVYKGEKTLSTVFDRVMLGALGGGCLITNLVIPLYCKL